MDLSIVIVSVNHAKFLRPCLTTLKVAMKGLEAELLLIDNRCDDNTAAITHELIPEATVIRTDVRYGFARANNLALAQAKGRYLMLLNPDTEVSPDSLAIIVEYLNSHPQVGVVGPRLLNPDGTLQPSCRAFPSLRSVFFRWLPFCPEKLRQRALRDYLALDWDHASARAVDWVLGACLCIRRETAEHTGWMDEGFFLYYEDIDWCYRVWKAGWEVHYLPEAVVMHHYQRTSAQHIFSRTTWIHARSIARFFLKHRLLRF